MQQRSPREWGVLILKWGLCAAVLLFVSLRASQLWQRGELHELSLQWKWVLLAIVAYQLSWIPSAWYWKRLLREMGQSVEWFDCLAAYYCGHLGKYIPGKATVLIIRAGMLKSRGQSAAVAAVTATFETLLMMGTGLAIGLALFPVTHWPPQWAETIAFPWVMPLLIVTAVIVALPLISFLLTRIATLATPRSLQDPQRPIRISIRTILVGLCAFSVSWGMLGLSLGFSLQAISGSSSGITSLDLTQWPVWTGAIALATSIGFIAIFAPGGIGVREALLIEILQIQPAITEKQAVVVSVLLRLIWLAAEISAAFVLYYLFRRAIRHERKTANDG